MNVGRGLLPKVVTPSDVDALQKAVKADASDLQTALSACAGFLASSSDQSSWQSLKARVDAFLAEESSWLHAASQMDRGEALQEELAKWHDRAKALACNVGPAPVLPGASSAEWSTTLQQALPLLLIFMVVTALMPALKGNR